MAFNGIRLERSLRLLRNVTEARLTKQRDLIEKHEAILRQHDYDAKDRVDPRQMTIFETSSK